MMELRPNLAHLSSPFDRYFLWMGRVVRAAAGGGAGGRNPGAGRRGEGGDGEGRKACFLLKANARAMAGIEQYFYCYLKAYAFGINRVK
jgi:hypothetical protein